MPNKIFSDVADYLVEGAKDKGYLKSGNGGFGDGKPSSGVTSFGATYNDQTAGGRDWFEGKKGNKAYGDAS